MGEIRDQETAEIATHAALTGHLVLSTLHTNDAPGALIRLVDLGVAPFLVASTVEAVLAQRLVRVICESCKKPVEPGPAFRGAGCADCRGTGYRGRTGIYELLVMNDEIRAELPRSRDVGELRVLAERAGTTSLAHDGMRLVREGITTTDEVLRVTRG